MLGEPTSLTSPIKDENLDLSPTFTKLFILLVSPITEFTEGQSNLEDQAFTMLLEDTPLKAETIRSAEIVEWCPARILKTETFEFKVRLYSVAARTHSPLC